MLLLDRLRPRPQDSQTLNPGCWSFESARSGANHVRRLFTDHHRGRIRIAADQRGHDRTIDDAQSLDTSHAQFAIDDRERVIGRPHPAGADRVVQTVGVAAHEGAQALAFHLASTEVFHGRLGS